MYKSIGKYLLPLLALAAVGMLAGCSQYSRHPDKDTLGDRTSKAEMEDALANMDKMMGMDMAARKKYMTKEQAKYLVKAVAAVAK